MVFTSLLRRFHARQSTLTSRKRPQTFRPQFEQLEPRQMLSAGPLVSGAAYASAGKAYQLDLESDVALTTDWTINWGDGHVDTVLAGASSASHTFANTVPVSVSATVNGGQAAVSLLGKFDGVLPLSQAAQVPSEAVVSGGFLYVADLRGDSVLRYDLANPSAAPTTIVDFGDGSQGGAYGLVVHGNDLYVSRWNQQSTTIGAIYKIDLTTLNTSLFADSSDGLNGPTGMTFDTAGNLYVANWFTNQVLRFDANGNPNPSAGNTGAVFVAAGNGLNTPAGVAFDASGNLLVTSRNSGQVLKYDGVTGAFISQFGDAGNGHLRNPQGITKGPDGDIYVADITGGEVRYFDGSTGAYLGTFEGAPNKGPVNVAFDPTGVDAHAYISNRSGYGGVNSVQQFEGPFAGSAAQSVAVNVIRQGLVNQTTTGLQGENLPQLPGREVGVDAAGNSVMVWSDSSAGGLPVIKARLFNAAGEARTSEFQVNTLVTSPNVASLPFTGNVGMAADGRFIAVYSGNGPNGFGLYFQRFNALGNKEGSETLFSSGQGGAPLVAYDANGGFIVTWTDGNPGHNKVQLQRFDSNGQKVGKQLSLGAGLDPDIAIATSGPSPGSFAVTWRDGTTVKLQRYSSSGAAQGSVITLNTVGQAPKLAYDASGNLAVTYKVDSTPHVAVRVYGPSGNALLGETFVDGGAVTSGSRPYITVDKTNHFVISWMATDADKEGIYSRRIANISGGVATLDPITAVNLYTAGTQHGVSMAGTSTGGYVIMWKGEGDEDFDGVYARFFTGV